MKNSSKQSVKMDMLHGSLFDKMLMFAMPLAACSILQQLFNSVGTAVVGRFASSEALAAVGSNSSVIALMVTLFSGISLGSNVVIANYIGQNDTKRIPRVVHTAVSLALIVYVYGVGISDDVKISNETKRIVCVEFETEESFLG